MSERIHGRKRRLTEEDIGDFVKRSKLEDILDLRSDNPEVSEICIGQALADVAGYKSNDNTLALRFQSAMEDIFFHGHTTADRKLEKVSVNNILLHSTDIYLYKFNGLIYMWYINPWGYTHDDTYIGKMEDFRKKHFDGVPGNDNIFPTSTANALNGHPPSEFEKASLWQDETDKINRIRSVVSGIPRMSQGDRDQMSHELAEYLFYSNIRSLATPRMLQLLNNILQGGVHYGVIHAVWLLTHIYQRRDIKIIFPSQSMSDDGPQARSGFSRKTDMICKHVNDKGEGLGDCAVWGRAYQVVARRHLSHARDDREVQEVIMIDLREMFLMGEKSARHFSGKVMLSTPLGKALRPMKIVYKTVPIEKVQIVEGRTAFKIHVRKVYDSVVANIKNMEFSHIVSVHQKQMYYIFVSFLDNIDSTESAKKQGPLSRILVQNVEAGEELQMMVAQFIRIFSDQDVKSTCKLLIDVALIMISCIFSSEIFEDSGLYITSE